MTQMNSARRALDSCVSDFTKAIGAIVPIVRNGIVETQQLSHGFINFASASFCIITRLLA